MPEFEVHEKPRDHTDDFASGGEATVCDRAHEPETAAAVDEADASLAKSSPRFPRRRFKGRI